MAELAQQLYVVLSVVFLYCKAYGQVNTSKTLNNWHVFIYNGRYVVALDEIWCYYGSLSSNKIKIDKRGSENYV